MEQRSDLYSLKEIFISLIPFFIAPLIWAYFGKLAYYTHFWQGDVELFCGLEGLALLIVAYKRVRSGYDIFSTLIRFGFFMTTLFFIGDIMRMPWDYERYLNAAKAICNGENPYVAEPKYLYPPFFAQTLCWVASLFQDLGMSSFASWHTVNYIYQVAQFYTIVYIHYELIQLYKLYESNGVKRELIIALLFIFNAPFYRNILSMQVNLFVLATALLAIRLAGSDKPLLNFLAGIPLALGTLIKLYPFILLIAIFILRRYRAIVSSILALLVLTLFLFVATPNAWLGYISKPIPEIQTTFFRNSAISAILASHANAFGFDVDHRIFRWVGLALSFAFAVPMLLSLVRKNFSTAGTKTASGLCFITLCIGLVLSPVVWEYHFVFAMPLAVWAIGEFGFNKKVLLPLALIFPIPVFDLVLFSVHRLVGLIWLILVSYKQICDEHKL